MSVAVTLVFPGGGAKEGAGIGVRLLWVVCLILGASLLLFFPGRGPEKIRLEKLLLLDNVEDPEPFGRVLAVVFPAFTGLIAGLGLSGDLRNPQRSVPLGTLSATLTGMAV